MTTNQIIAHFRKTAKPFSAIDSFSNKPGIYAVFFMGNSFPLLGDAAKKESIIYIGKTESSQEKRDLKTHFSTGKTGSSTLRKSIGSILCFEYQLTPIPRNSSDYAEGRKSHFKFDQQSESKITEWMICNLSLAYYPFTGTTSQLDTIETGLISTLVPLLNLAKNPHNPFKQQIEKLRSNCAAMAHKSTTQIQPQHKATITNHKYLTTTKMSGKYIELWQKTRPAILNCLKNENTNTVQLNKADFDKVGNRQSYAFNLELIDGSVSNDIGGSAVARDLAKVLQNSSEIMRLIKDRHYKLRMNRGFLLTVNRIS